MPAVPPQPAPERMVPVPGHPLVVGVVPGQSGLVALTAAAFGTLTLASCGGSEEVEVDPAAQNVGAMETFEADQQFTATEPLTVTMLWTDWPEQPVTESWQAVSAAAESATNTRADRERRNEGMEGAPEQRCREGMVGRAVR